MSEVPLREATEVLFSLLRGERTWAHVGPPYAEMGDGDCVLLTNDGWVVSLHSSYDELKHTAYMIAPDGRRGDERIWAPEALAAGKLWGDPLDALAEGEFDYFEHLAMKAPAVDGPMEGKSGQP